MADNHSKKSFAPVRIFVWIMFLLVVFETGALILRELSLYSPPKEVNSWILGDEPVNSIMRSGGHLYILQSVLNKLIVVDRFTGKIFKTIFVKNSRAGVSLPDGKVVLLAVDPMRLEVYEAGRKTSVVIIADACDPKSFVVDDDGFFYISDTMLGRIIKVDSQGRVISTVQLTETPQKYDWGGAIAVDRNSNIYTYDNLGNVKTYNQAGELINSWNTILAGKVNYWRQFVIGADNLVYILGRDFHTVFVFDVKGHYKGRFSEGSNRKNRLYYPSYISADSEYIYVFAKHIITYGLFGKN